MFYAVDYFVSSSCYDVDSWNGKARHSSKRTKSADMGCRFVCMSLFHTEHCPTEIMNMFETESKHKPPNPNGCIFLSVLLLAELSDVYKPAVRTCSKGSLQCRKLQYSGHFYLKNQPSNKSKRNVVELTSLVYWSQSWKQACEGLYFSSLGTVNYNTGS